MKSQLISEAVLAATMTRAANRPTYYIIRFLVDNRLVEDAYRAYAYFRWVDDWLDQEARPRPERLAFVKRQQALLEGCWRGEPPVDLAPQECMLVSLVAQARRDPDKNSGLHAYLRDMMAVMAFDADRRGQLVSRRELNQYTHWLAVAVTEAMHYFIGHACASPHGKLRYVAVTGAHITHMLRDALEDAEAGYYNIPLEVVAASGIAPWDVESRAYRDWVKERVHEARACFRTGREYLSQVENLRCRIAGYAYLRRFEATLDWIEREGCLLQAHDAERSGGCGMEMIAWAVWMALRPRQSVRIGSALRAR